MSFKQFDNEDVIVSADSISSTVWSTDTYELTTFETSSTQEAASSGDYYLNIYQTGSDEKTSADLTTEQLEIHNMKENK